MLESDFQVFAKERIVLRISKSLASQKSTFVSASFTSALCMPLYRAPHTTIQLARVAGAPVHFVRGFGTILRGALRNIGGERCVLRPSRSHLQTLMICKLGVIQHLL